MHQNLELSPDERGKQDVVVDDMYNFHQYYDPFGRRKYY
jgi:hypothetical protein